MGLKEVNSLYFRSVVGLAGCDYDLHGNIVEIIIQGVD